MRRRCVLLVLASLTLVPGCHALLRDVGVAEYRPGTAPITTVAECDATYRIHTPEKMETGVDVAVTKGMLVGFRREPDGSLVAVAGEKTIPVPDCHHVWLCTPKPITRWDRFATGTRDKCEDVIGGVGSFLLLPFIIVNGCLTGEWP